MSQIELFEPTVTFDGHLFFKNARLRGKVTTVPKIKTGKDNVPFITFNLKGAAIRIYSQIDVELDKSSIVEVHGQMFTKKNKYEKSNDGFIVAKYIKVFNDYKKEKEEQELSIRCFCGCGGFRIQTINHVFIRECKQCGNITKEGVDF